MERSIIFSLLLFFSFSAIAQMTSDDKLLEASVFDPYGLCGDQSSISPTYSNGQIVQNIIHVANCDSLFTYYFNGNIAMRLAVFPCEIDSLVEVSKIYLIENVIYSNDIEIELDSLGQKYYTQSSIKIVYTPNYSGKTYFKSGSLRSLCEYKKGKLSCIYLDR